MSKTKKPIKRILGISALDKDATACVYIDGEWKVIAEERLSRVKMHAGFPKRAIDELLKSTGLRPEDVQQVVYPFMPWWMEGSSMLYGYLHDIPFALTNNTPWDSKYRHLRTYWKWCIDAISDHHKYHYELIHELNSMGLHHKLARIEHHTSHAAAAYLTSGFDEALALTFDWYGGGLSGSVNLCNSKGIKRIHNFLYPHSMGLFYAQVTSALGFKSSQHEGKIVGLAAFGDISILGAALLERFVCKGGNFHYCSGMDPELSKNLARRYPREDVAAAYQYVLETIICRITSWWLQKTGLRNVVMAGGVAANVKLNHRISDLEEVHHIFIHPNMGDGGTCVGAILASLLENGDMKSKEWETCYLGPNFSSEQMEAAIKQAGLIPNYSESSEKDIAKILADGKVVARFTGAMEYGPRALGNRSILYPATDAKVNKWLNERLGRTEFMPFAPVTLFEHYQGRYINIDKSLASTRFMTITCDCTDLMKKESPAAVHVDGTARPQIIRREDNPSFHSLLEEYYKLTGIPTLINTSFNMHEEPIVCSPEDAVRAFMKGNLDCLSMGPFIVNRKYQDKRNTGATESDLQLIEHLTRKNGFSNTVSLKPNSKEFKNE